MTRKRALAARPVAVITGGGKRLGGHIAVALAENGYDIAINYLHSRSGARRIANQVASSHRRCLIVRADISQKKQVRRMVTSIVRHFGRIDLLVNNSSVFIRAPFPGTREKAWDDTIDINLKGVFLCSQAVIPYLSKHSDASIVNIASLGGIQAWKNYLPYSVSKAGVVMLTKCLAKALAPGIRVNAVAPGTIGMVGEEKFSGRRMPLKKIPMNRYGKPSDITDAVIYLATKARYVTGQIFVIDGGTSIN